MSEHSSEACYEDLEELREDLAECLGDSECGVFASGQIFEESPNPGLCVQGVGLIGLPLADTSALKHVSHQAPFGKGEQTIVAESVRKTWEINANALSFLNPGWQAWINTSILPKITANLGVDVGSQNATVAELYKLLLYEEGAMFKPHQDSEKAQGMYGTLVICLPTAHEGGNVVLRHGKRTITWESSIGSSYNTSCFAWYADVIHEVQPVSSGHRLVLTYNLINRSRRTSDLTAASLGHSEARLQRVLTNWKSSAFSKAD